MTTIVALDGQLAADRKMFVDKNRFYDEPKYYITKRGDIALTASGIRSSDGQFEVIAKVVRAMLVENDGILPPTYEVSDKKTHMVFTRNDHFVFMTKEHLCEVKITVSRDPKKKDSKFLKVIPIPKDALYAVGTGRSVVQTLYANGVTNFKDIFKVVAKVDVFTSKKHDVIKPDMLTTGAWVE